MLPRPKTASGVVLFSALSAAISIVVTLIAVPLGFDIDDPWDVLPKAALVAFSCAFPSSFILFNEIRKNEKLTGTLQRLVDRDRLTDIATRDFFFARMAEAPDAYGVSLMVDIDHFKRINDTYGHMAGDAVIKAVATLLRDSVRPEDIVARFGGEEFMIFLHDHSADAGFHVAERMRQTVADAQISHGDLIVSVTVSIGGGLKEACADISGAIQHADLALYQAKNDGRNRTVFHDRRRVAPPLAL
ncbi:GGDEF domain-containing protein [Loktanella agnita]|uniref:GGDEF domain-containing protein n=1 Tax=Loktanella agnita TaxID=287097 RepID=UPI0039869002